MPYDWDQLFPTRIANVLYNSPDLQKIEDLNGYSFYQLSMHRNLGVKSIRLMQSILEPMGIFLCDDVKTLKKIVNVQAEIQRVQIRISKDSKILNSWNKKLKELNEKLKEANDLR